MDQFGLTKPAEILTKANELFLDFMNANESNVAHDGMDICLCSIDANSNTIHFAGAKRPLYLVTQKDNFNPIKGVNNYFEVGLEDMSLYEIKGNNSSIGGDDLIFHVEDQIFEYNKGDVIYLGSDGYADQFGGEDDRKFKSKRLKNLLLSFQGKSMSDQKEILAQEFQNWMGDKEQTDDVTIMGIKL